MTTNDATVISHIYQEDDGKWVIQSNETHCRQTATLCSEFAEEFGMGEWGKMIGLLHDKGKERPGFQCHIRVNSGYDSTARSDDSHLHSSAGAILAHRLKEDCLYWLSNPIAGHHRGLYDTIELEAMVRMELPTNVDSTLPEIMFRPSRAKPLPEEASHVCRMLFSCLVDADRLDTERFMNPEKNAIRRAGTTMHELKKRLDRFRTSLAHAADTPLNHLRNEIQRTCDSKGYRLPGLFSLTVPTGGGKTLASMIWAIRHALQHGKRRIIVAIPFTSIIVQTAETLRSIFGEENVIEHHSAVESDTQDERSCIACENWDAPIIVTTNVQLFESMFSNKPSRCRKLHAICNSIVILDEVQALPMSFLQPIVEAMQSYTKLFGVSFLLCTASQPVLEGIHKGCGNTFFRGFETGSVTPLIDSTALLHVKLKRTSVEIDTVPRSYDEIAARLADFDCVLCIVNTRRHAYEIFRRLPDDGIPTFHLSRMMCPAHILNTITEIKSLLSQSDKKVRVVSTQLIEAGVDIDFPVVYRQLTGLDSILQASGRCNREGKLPLGQTTVFSLNNDRPFGAIGFAADAMKQMISLYPDIDWLSPEAVSIFFRKLYANTPSFDRQGIGTLLKNPLDCRYEEASDKFRLIDDDCIPVIVPYGEASFLAERIRRYGPSMSLSRKLGRFSVSVRRYLFNELKQGELIEELVSGFWYMPLATQYDSSTGLKTDNEYVEQTLII